MSGGLDSLPAFKDANSETKRAFEEEMLRAASATIDAVFAAVSGKLDLRNPRSWAFCLPACLSIVKTVLPKDQVLLSQAAEYANTLLKTTPEPVPEKPVEAVKDAATTLPGTATS
jgi:hypothetical protein